MALSFEGKVALVTGGASGMGLATAKLLAELGAKVAIADINMDLAQESAAAIGGIAIKLDQGDGQSVQNAVEAVEKEYGGLDLAVNNAAIQGQLGALDDLEDDDIARVTAVNLNGVIYSLKYEVRAIKKRGGTGGAIVNIASVAGMQPQAFVGPYSAAKAGVIAITKSAAVEFGPDRIRINAVSPGYIDTPLMRAANIDPDFAAAKVPLLRCGQPQDIAELVVFLLSDKAKHLHGANVNIDGGLVAGTSVKPPAWS